MSQLNHCAEIANVEQSASPLAASHWHEAMFLPLFASHGKTALRTRKGAIA
jgi:hypothetical protein